MSVPTTPRAPRTGFGGFAQVTTSQLALAAGSYLVIIACGRTVDAAALAVVTAFYLLLNTVGRGLCSALELHLTRAVADDLTRAARPGAAAAGAGRAAVRQGAALLGLALALTAAFTPLLNRVFDGDLVLVVLLGASLPGMAVSYAVRGLLAGRRRYARYALSFWAEAGTTLSVGTLLFATGQGSARWWVVAFGLGPAVAGALLLAPAVVARANAGHGSRTAANRVSGLAWSVLILGGSQAVWNLGPVVLAGRLAGPGTAAVTAGFATAALIMRIPVLLFPAVQAVLLPVLTAGGGRLRVPARWWAAGAAVGVAWLLVAAFLVRPVATAVLAGQALPSAGPLVLLASATLVGGCAQLAVTAVIARGDYPRAALAWTAALVVLIAGATVLPATAALTATALVAAVLVALIVLVVPGERRRG